MIFKNYIFTLCLLISLASLTIKTSVCYGTPIDAQRIAVLELVNNAQLPKAEIEIVTDTVRGEIAELLGKRFTMITKENILVLVDQETCNRASEASCEVEMGKTLNAHYIITGTLTRLETRLYLTLKVHQTASSQLLGNKQGFTESTKSLLSQVAPRLARDIAVLIDPQVASRSETLTASIDALQKELGSAKKEKSSDDFASKLKQLRETEIKKEETTGDGSDEEYQRELKRIADTVAERKKHNREVAEAWTNVQELARQDTTKGILAVRLFIDTYGSHRLGNPKASEAQDLLSQLQDTLVREKHERLSKAHLKVVRADWEKVRPIINVGDKASKKALDLFLKTYADHPMGNPLATKAKKAFRRAVQRRNTRLKAEHEQNVKRDWLQVRDTIRKGGRLGQKALSLFLDKYRHHPLGNSYASRAQSTYQRANIRIAAEQSKAHQAKLKQEWAYISDSIKNNPRGTQKSIKLVELFIDKYSNHPLGNYLEPDAKQVLFALKLGKAPSGNEEDLNHWAVGHSASARKSQYLKKALLAFMSSVGFTAMTAYGGYLYEPTLQALKDQGYQEVSTGKDEYDNDYEKIEEITMGRWIFPLVWTNLLNIVWLGGGEGAWQYDGSESDFVSGTTGALVLLSSLTTAVGAGLATGLITEVIKDGVRSKPPGPTAHMNSLIWFGALGTVVSMGFTQYYLSKRKTIRGQNKKKSSTFYFTPVEGGAMTGFSWEW